jgi:molybdenum cofactor guanylyltransferase
VTGSSPEAPLGVLLAGGMGRRMGGNKPHRMLYGQRLIDRALELLSQVCPSYVVVTGDPDDLPGLDCPVLGDIWPGLGPLGGLVTAFIKTKAQWIQAFPVDAPLVNPEMLRVLHRRAQGQTAVVIRAPKGLEPLLALYGPECLRQAQRFLEQGERRPWRLLSSCGALEVPWDEVRHLDPEEHTFLNINRDEDLLRAQEILSRQAE